MGLDMSVYDKNKIEVFYARKRHGLHYIINRQIAKKYPDYDDEYNQDGEAFDFMGAFDQNDLLEILADGDIKTLEKEDTLALKEFTEKCTEAFKYSDKLYYSWCL